MAHPQNLIEMLEQSVHQFRERPALWDPNPQDGYNTWTYDGLWKDIRNVASHLSALGIGAGDKVGLLANSRAWWPICDYAIMSLSACTVPIYPSLPSNQIEFVIQHAEMKGLIVQDDIQLQKLLDIASEALPHLEFVVVLSSTLPERLRQAAEQRYAVHDYARWMASRAALDEATWASHWRTLQANDLATIVYTSGTTGQPKGVQLSHGNLIANVVGMGEIVKLRPTDRSLSYLPLSHIFERTCGQFYTLHVGASIAYSRGFAQIVDDFRKIPPTVLTTVPRLLEKIQETVVHQVQAGPKWRKRIFEQAVAVGTTARLEKQPVSRWKLGLYDRLVFHKLRGALGGNLRAIIVGGAPMPNYVGRFFTAAGLSVAEGYGLTETAPVVSANPPESPRLGTAGKVVPNISVRIAEDGEVLVQGPSVMRGYYRNEEATSEAFTEDGWFHTGDIGELSEDGYLQITDRKKNLLVLSTGKKVTPAPIEGEILNSPFIDQVLLLGQGRKYVSVIVVPNELALKDRWGKLGRTLPPQDSWTHNSELVDFLFGQVQSCTHELAKFEQPKKLLIAHEAFTVDNEQLTPTLKVRGKNVLAAYASQIEHLYSE